MNTEPHSFEEYERPPVTEVALSVQFEPLRNLRTPHIGLLWAAYQKEGLTKVDERSPLAQAFELFGDEKLLPSHVEITDIPPVPRCWFSNEGGTELVQVQQDRFVHNWSRRNIDEDYPRYTTIRASFIKDLKVFEDFLGNCGIGKLNPNQSEITYVNPITSEADWTGVSGLEKVLTMFELEYSDAFLQEPDDISIGLRYVIHDDGSPLGRLYVAIQTRSTPEGQNVFLLKLTARGRPIGDGIEGALRFLDKGHEWIVRGFTSVTTPLLHQHWGHKK